VGKGDRNRMSSDGKAGNEPGLRAAAVTLSSIMAAFATVPVATSVGPAGSGSEGATGLALILIVFVASLGIYAAVYAVADALPARFRESGWHPCFTMFLSSLVMGAATLTLFGTLWGAEAGLFGGFLGGGFLRSARRRD